MTGSSRLKPSFALRLFYRVKPLIPRRAQIGARRVRARAIWRRLHGDAVAHLPVTPTGYRWPDGYRACALLTHDVETAVGQAAVNDLARIEEARELRSCWNFVVKRYSVDLELVRGLQARGHEIGVHGVYHDGREFESPQTFESRITLAYAAAHSWGARGFRAPSLLSQPDLLRTLAFSWDSSLPAFDPFQPRPGNCHVYVPFWLSSTCVELPVTLWQDFTLLEELRVTALDVWRQQIDALCAAGALINVIVHPDYIDRPVRLRMYEQLVDYLKTKEGIWITQPSQVADWHRATRSGDA